MEISVSGVVIRLHTLQTAVAVEVRRNVGVTRTRIRGRIKLVYTVRGVGGFVVRFTQHNAAGAACVYRRVFRRLAERVVLEVVTKASVPKKVKNTLFGRIACFLLKMRYVWWG